MVTFRGGTAKHESAKLPPSFSGRQKIERRASGSLLEEINRAVKAITIECYDTPPERRRQAIDFLARGRRMPLVTHTLSDALRHFSHLLTDNEKLKIAELLSENEAMSLQTRDYVRCSLERAIQKEVSLEVGEALRRLYHKVSG